MIFYYVFHTTNIEIQNGHKQHYKYTNVTFKTFIAAKATKKRKYLKKEVDSTLKMRKYTNTKHHHSNILILIVYICYYEQH